METAISLQCALCKHHRLGLRCAAFPSSIPETIITGQHDHTEPYPGDRGIRFEPVDELPIQPLPIG